MNACVWAGLGEVVGEEEEWEDVDEDLISFTINNPPFWISYDESNGEVTAMPTSVQAGQYELLYTIHEDNNGCYSQSFTHSLTVE